MITIENSSAVTLAYLNEIEDGTVSEALNGEFSLSFVALINPLKTEFLYDNTNLLVYKYDLFRVVQFEELHNDDNLLTVLVKAEHVSYDTIKNEFVDFNYTAKTASEVMLNCLLGTNFIFRSCDITATNDIQIPDVCNSKQISIAIANIWGGELQYHRYYVDLLVRRGENRGVDFRFGKNIKNIKRIVNFAEDTIAYEIEVVEGSELEDFGYYELGDTVRVIDDAMLTDYETRIIEIHKNIITGINTKVILGSQIKDLRNSFDTVRKDVADVKQVLDNSAADWDRINDILDESGNLIPGRVVGELNLAVMSIINGTGTFEQRGNMSYWQNQPTKANSTFASMWNANGISFSNSKDGLGEWVWRSALDATGITADKVTASAISSMSIEAISALVQNLVARTITGVTIEGSTIYAGNRGPGGSYTEITTQGRIRGYSGGKRTFELYHSSEGNLILGTDLDTYGTDYIQITPHATMSTNYGTYSGPKISVTSGRDLILSAGRIIMDGVVVTNP